MENTLQNTRKVKCKIVIIALSIIAILVGSLSDLIYLSDWFIDGNIFDIIESLVFDFDLSYARTIIVLFFNVINVAITILPCVFIIAYVLFLYKKFSSRFVLSLVFLLLAYPSFRSIIYFALNIFDVNQYSDSFLVSYFLQQILINILSRLPLLLAAILVLFGIKNRVVYIISLLFALIAPVWWGFSAFIDLVKLIVEDIYFLDSLVRDLLNSTWIFGDMLWGIGLFAIIVATMIFIIANNNLIPKAKKLKAIVEDPDIKNLSDEDAFNVLKIKLNLGEITEQEYEEQRKIIIDKV